MLPQHTSGMSQRFMKLPQGTCRLIQYVYLSYDLVLIGHCLIGFNIIPELDHAREQHLSPL